MGRQLDYPVGFNIIAQPRRDEPGGVSFPQLRALADNYDLLRLVIETRKDQLTGLSWNIVGRNKKDKIKADDKRVLELEKFLRRPDGVLSWGDWLRKLVEDLLVIDAPAVYVRKNRGGGVFSLDVVDGATIKLLINNDGRRPLAPDPAYVQVLKGMPAVHYTSQELLYKPRNLRSWKQYGMSPVEQVIMTVNIALRRQISQLQYYTEGNIPEALASCPETWTPDQVNRMQTLWDGMMEGNSAMKRHMKFIPGGVDVSFTREAMLKDMFDEWLARILCFAFSISPQALIQMMNRATAESAAEQAELEGLAPIQTWVKEFIDDIIENVFGFDDLVFAWDKGEELDPKTQADIHAIYLANQVLDADEVREDIGRDPRATRQAATVEGGAPVPGEGDHGTLEPGQAGDGAGAANPLVAAAGAPPSSSTGDTPTPTDANAQAGAAPQTQPAGAAATGGGDLTMADTAMNGTQISSLLEIVSAVANNELPEATARAMINAAFPFIKEDLVNGMLAGLEQFEPPKPEPVLGPNGLPLNPALPGGDKKEGAVPAAKAGEEADHIEEADDKKIEKARGHNHGVSVERRRQMKNLKGALSKVLADVGANVAKQVRELRDEPVAEEVAKAGKDSMGYVKKLLGKIELHFEDIAEDLNAALTITATSAAERELSKIKSKHEDALDLANTRAEKWAKDRAAELIGKAADGGELADSTRDMLRATIVQAEEEGWSNSRLADELESNYAFSKQRAETIARTETKSADSEGAIAGWRESGLKMKKEWVRSANDYDCDICEANEQQGPIDLEKDFDSGDDTAPAHPNCECVVQSVIDQEQEL